MRKILRKECKHHGDTDHIQESSGYFRCKMCRSGYVSANRKKMRIKAVEYAGGKCVRCGYDKCSAALEFHHRDPTKKEFELSTGTGKSWERVKTEIEKCDLLCANCHREIHEELVQREGLEPSIASMSRK